MPTITDQPQVNTPAPAITVQVEFGEGRYSKVMNELFNDSQRLLGLQIKQAEKLARSFGAELGRYQGDVQFKYGRVSKDNKMTLREITTIKGLTVTYAIALARACVLLQEATGFGVNTYSKITLDKQFVEWLDK